jgi:RNA polymerase sigma-70 factor (ECF subfamily)
VYGDRRVSDRFNEEEHRRWEKRCVERARKGDRAAFAELYEVYAPELFRRVLVPRLGNRQAAEDALSETFRTLLERLDQYEDRGKSLWSWLCRVAVNKATDMHRVKGRTSRALASFEGLLAPLLEGPSNPGAEVETQIEAEHLGATVTTVLDKLNPRYRRAIELRFLEDKPREECAVALEVKIGTFDVLILRALRAFRREWEATVGPSREETVSA